MASSEKETTLREFEGEWCDDGYEFMGHGEAHGWRAVAAWGEDGWDLGDWPYVVVLFRDRIVRPSTLDNDPAVKIYERAVYVEGDIEIERWTDAEDRQRSTDELAAMYWRNAGVGSVGKELWAALDSTPVGQPLPERFRGPYRRRLDTSDAAA